jgi:alkylated DNA nucleotide flippase Atl1
MAKPHPKIKPLQWTALRDILPNEAHDFTPWLADNLDLLADVLGLDDLELVGTEAAVDAFRVDLRATGTDGSGDEIAVVIENQYDKTDHDHLGKLVTYAARADTEAERTLAVWIVEQPVAAHLAAIEFLNRISSGQVGWVLISPRFVPAPDEGFYVHFEKHAEPNAFLRSPSPGGVGTVPPERAAFMAELFDQVDEPLRHVGFRHVWSHPYGHMIRAYLPKAQAASNWAEVRVLAAKHRLRVVLFVRGGQAPAEYNIDVLEGIRQRHEAAVQQRLGPAWPIEWHARNENDRSDYARITWDDHGYLDPAAADAATIVVKFAQAFLEALAEDTDVEFPDPDELEATGTSANTATVKAIAACIEPGEWATYGDVSTVAIGSSSAAMAVGNIAANTPDFPYPHRILSRNGTIPDGWSTGDGGGPDECRRRLEEEGIKFNAHGGAAKEQRVDTEVLRARWEDRAT